MVVPGVLVTQFQTSVTYMVAGSLILTGLVQLAFTRFVSDRLFEKRKDAILPNLHGLMLVTTLAAAAQVDLGSGTERAHAAEAHLVAALGLGHDGPLDRHAQGQSLLDSLTGPALPAPLAAPSVPSNFAVRAN